MLAVGAPNGVEDPVAVAAHEERFLTGLGVDHTQGVVGATKGDGVAVGRPARAIDRVKGDRLGELELLLRHVPNLDLSHARRTATGDGDHLSVGRPSELLDALGQSDQAGGNPGTVRLVNQHFMVTGHREEFAVGRVLHRSHRGWRDVDRRFFHREGIACLGGFRRVIGGSFLHPFPNESDLAFVERIALGRHFRLAIDRRGNGQEVGLVRLARDDGAAFLTPREEFGKLRHDVVALRLRRLVATRAVGLQDRADVLVKGDRFVFVGRFTVRRRSVEYS